MAFAVAARWVANAGEEEEVLRCLNELAPASRAEQGCRFYQANRELDDPRVYFLYEIYDDRAAADAHWASDHFKRHALEDAIPRLESRERWFYTTVDAPREP
jgi:quinol monooxygenase YgiN